MHEVSPPRRRLVMIGRIRAACVALALAVPLLIAPWPAYAATAAPPEVVVNALRGAGIPLSATSIVVTPLDGPGLEATLNADVPRNPASTMKLLTTYAALRTLGPAYTWHTDVLLAGSRDGETVRGDLVLRGGGDPSLVVEQLWLLVQQLRGLGLRDLRGDLVLGWS